MSTLSQESVTTITVKYDARDIQDIDIQSFKTDLDELGYTRVRGHVGPMAGTGGVVWILITFIGIEAVRGIIRHLAVQFYNKFSNKLLSFIKRPSHSFTPNITGIKISYDDIDIEIQYVDESIAKKIPIIMNDVVNEITNGGLKGFKSGTITMPMEIRGSEWKPFFIEESSTKYDYPFRYWNVFSLNMGDCFGIYDFADKKFL